MLYDELFSFSLLMTLCITILQKCTNLCEWHDNFMCNKNDFFSTTIFKNYFGNFENSTAIILLQSLMQIIDIEISFFNIQSRNCFDGNLL